MILLRPRGPRRSWAALLGGRADPFFTSRPPFFTSASQWSHDQGGESKRFLGFAIKTGGAVARRISFCVG